VIDVLQVWDHSKQLERFFKTCCLRKDKNGISAVPPSIYRDRFMKNIDAITEKVGTSIQSTSAMSASSAAPAGGEKPHGGLALH
jgi:hypothetical protein